MIAGPSEIMVVADETANPVFVELLRILPKRFKGSLRLSSRFWKEKK